MGQAVDYPTQSRQFPFIPASPPEITVDDVLHLDLNSALTAARQEKSYRGQCQCMAWVARFVRDQKHVAKTAEAAAAVALQDEDAYSAVFPLAWPIRAMLERGEQKRAERLLDDALERAKTVTPASSQSEALFLLFQAAMFEKDRYWEKPFAALLRNGETSEHWRQRRNVQDAICMVASVDYPFAKQAAQALADAKQQAKVLELLSTGKKQSPRPFFW